MFNFLKSTKTLEDGVRKWFADDMRLSLVRTGTMAENAKMLNYPFEWDIGMVLEQAVNKVMMDLGQSKRFRKLVGKTWTFAETMHSVRGINAVNAYAKRVNLKLVYGPSPYGDSRWQAVPK